MPARVVAPTRVKGGISSGMEVAPGPLPTMTSIRKSSIAIYSISSAGRAMRWISSMKSTSPSIRFESMAAKSPARSKAGPEVIRSEVPNSWEIIIAMVVLPRPGGPESRTWSGVTPRFLAPLSTKESCSRTLGWPINSSSDFGRNDRSISCSSECAVASTSLLRCEECAASMPSGRLNSVRSISDMIVQPSCLPLLLLAQLR